eukprot:873447-Amphidinium_carterae.1
MHAASEAAFADYAAMTASSLQEVVCPTLCCIARQKFPNHMVCPNVAYCQIMHPASKQPANIDATEAC